jgi:hypothetical protein
MNERIRELAEQAGFYVADGKIYIPSTSEEITTCQKNFAELIIQECATRTLDHRSDDYYQGWLDYRDEIKQHFGVES